MSIDATHERTKQSLRRAELRIQVLESDLAAIRKMVTQWMTFAPRAFRDNGLMLPGDRETWAVREVRESSLRALLAHTDQKESE